MFFTDTPVDMRFRYRDKVLTLNRVGGTGHSILMISLALTGRVEFVDFHYQDRPLRLREAIDKAKDVEAWFRAAGFRYADPTSPFQIREPETARPVGARTWSDAEAALSDEGKAIAVMNAFALQTADAKVEVTLENWRRQAQAFGNKARLGLKDSSTGTVGMTIYDGNGGYEWGLHVVISARSSADAGIAVPIDQTIDAMTP